MDKKIFFNLLRITLSCLVVIMLLTNHQSMFQDHITETNLNSAAYLHVSLNYSVFINYFTAFLFKKCCIWLQDEKLQHILGHFQKEFEGEVSVENLGKSNCCCRLISFDAFGKDVKQRTIFDRVEIWWIWLIFTHISAFSLVVSIRKPTCCSKH